jgi:hypothetical protein
MECLDLHGVDYEDAEFLIEKFVTDNFDDLPVKIVSGNSRRFSDLIKEIVDRHDLECHKEMWFNEGAWVITKF